MLRKLALACIATFAISASAQAAMIGVTLQAAPDIASVGMASNYNFGTQAFSASGLALSLNGNFISSGTFNLTATVNNSGVASGGSLTITGSVLSFGSPLLTGSLNQMGYSTTILGLFDFIFTVTGGSMAINGQYGLPGTQFGVILNTNGSSFTGSWGQNFSSNSGGQADTAPMVPAPGALALLLAGMCGARSRRRTA